MQEITDILVVGGGMGGISAAAELAPHASVIVLETEPQPGYHATGRSAAFYTAGYGSGPVRQLTLGSATFLRRQSPEGNMFLRRRGGLFLGTHDQQLSLDALLEASGDAFQLLDGAEVCAMIPILKRSSVAGAVYDPEGADIDVDLLHQHYLRTLKAHGGKIFCNETFHRAVPQGEGWLVETPERQIRCGTMLNAGGAWADDVAVRAGLAPLGLQPKRRTAALIDAPTNPGFSEWPGVIDIDEQYYFKPDAGLLLVSPADETDVEPHDAFADDLALAEGIERIMAVADIHVTRAPRAWAGLRTFAIDRMPVIGRDLSASAPFFWLAAQGGYGIQTAPATAELTASLIIGGPLPKFADDALTAALSPSRLRR